MLEAIVHNQRLISFCALNAPSIKRYWNHAACRDTLLWEVSQSEKEGFENVFSDLLLRNGFAKLFIEAFLLLDLIG